MRNLFNSNFISKLLLLLTFISTLIAQEPTKRVSWIENGVLMVEGKPFQMRSAWWGANHWMAGGAKDSISTQLALSPGLVGTDRDYYAQGLFNTTFYTWVGGGEPAVQLLKETVERAKKTNLKVMIHIANMVEKENRVASDWVYVTETGETKEIAREFLHYNTEVTERDMVKQYGEVFKACGDDRNIIGYQIGGETWSIVSYDEKSLENFREYLKKDFSLSALSERYGGKKDFYKDWNDVYPAIGDGSLDFKKIKIPNGFLNRYDWARYNRHVHAQNWIAMVKTFQKLDGNKRFFSYEYNHGPYSGNAYGLNNFDFDEICAAVPQLCVGGGTFPATLAESMHSLYVKTSCPGPWYTNELGVAIQSVHPLAKAAFVRKQAWWNAAMGFDGFNYWTFFNLLGLKSEFIGGNSYDVFHPDNLPKAYMEARNVNRKMNAIADVLAGSRPFKPTIGVLYLDDSCMTGRVGSYKALSHSWLMALAALGYADQTSIITQKQVDETSLESFKAIILPESSFIFKSRQEKLADYVKRGGTLILSGPSGLSDETAPNNSQESTPIISKLSGTQLNLLTDKELATTPIAYSWNDKTVHFDVRGKLKPTQAQSTLLKGGTQPLILSHKIEEGACISLAGRPLIIDDDDPTIDLLGELLTQRNIAPFCRPIDDSGKRAAGVYVGSRVHADGILVIFIENMNRPVSFQAEIDSQSTSLQQNQAYTVHNCFVKQSELLSSQTHWKFPVKLPPSGVSVFWISKKSPPPSTLQETPEKAADIFQIIESFPEAEHYLNNSASMGEIEAKRLETISGDEVKALPAKDLGKKFLGLDIGAFANRPWRHLIRTGTTPGNFFGVMSTSEASDETTIVNNQAQKTISHGDVPVSLGKGFVDMDQISLQGIPVDSKVQSIHFFHHAVLWIHDQNIGFYRINYEDGTSLRLPIVIGVNLSEMSYPWNRSVRTTTVWTSEDKSKNLSRWDWTNPHPELKVTSIDVIRTTRSNFYIWGITARAE